MRKTFVCLTLAVIFCALALLFSTSYSGRTAHAAQQVDPCVECQAQVQRRLEKCEAKAGGPTLKCYDQFNKGIVECYATVCEQ
ncbi:MAG TPA: hypothetical protein VGW12_11905 [Pyrinomonadaceae bacterium]|nr:hypothetical protein [Pyrinomonadaceae bacterium]